MPGTAASAIQALWRHGIDVLYVDKVLVVLNKVAGTVSQPTFSTDPDKVVSTPWPFFL